MAAGWTSGRAGLGAAVAKSKPPSSTLSILLWDGRCHAVVRGSEGHRLSERQGTAAGQGKGALKWKCGRAEWAGGSSCRDWGPSRVLSRPGTGRRVALGVWKETRQGSKAGGDGL